MQSNYIAGALFIAFLIFVTLRGELPVYIDILRGGGAVPAGTQNTSIGNLPNTIDGAQVIVGTNPNDATNPVQQLLNNPSNYSIPSINSSSFGQAF